MICSEGTPGCDHEFAGSLLLRRLRGGTKDQMKRGGGRWNEEGSSGAAGDW